MHADFTWGQYLEGAIGAPALYISEDYQRDSDISGPQDRPHILQGGKFLCR